MRWGIVAIGLVLGYPVAASAGSSPKCPGESGSFFVNNRDRNPKRGGFVSDGADVAEGAHIGRAAVVCGSAIVTNSARITGKAIIRGEAQIGNRSRVFGSAVVEGNAQVKGKAKVSGNARVYGEATIQGTAAVRQNAAVFGNAVISKRARVSGHAKISGTAVIGGTAIVRGWARLNTGKVLSGVLSPPQPKAEVKRAAVARKAAAEARRRAAVHTKASYLNRFENRDRAGTTTYKRTLHWRGNCTFGFRMDAKFRCKGRVQTHETWSLRIDVRKTTLSKRYATLHFPATPASHRTIQYGQLAFYSGRGDSYCRWYAAKQSIKTEPRRLVSFKVTLGHSDERRFREAWAARKSLCRLQKKRH